MLINLGKVSASTRDPKDGPFEEALGILGSLFSHADKSQCGASLWRRDDRLDT